MIDKKFKIVYLALIIFTIILLFESFFWHYSSKLSWFCFDTLSFSERCIDDWTHHRYTYFDRWRMGYNPIIWNENGLIETLQILFLFISILYFIKILILKRRNKKNLFYFILIFYLICLLYYFFEEISWGQHYFHWESSDYFINNNNQQETNLHNMSNLFDQLPRSFLSIWCGLSFIIFIFFKKFSSNQDYLLFILPSKNLKKISFLILIFILPEKVLDFFFTDIDYATTTGINFADIYTFFSLNFIRLSEFQELLFTIYILYHSIFYKKYLEAKI